jgi:hypothetical protein
MNENTSPQLEQCAELATWHQLETDQAQRERIAAELEKCVMQAAREEAERRALQEAKAKAEAEKKADADKEAKAEKNAQEAQAKAAEAAEHAAWEKGMQERQDRDREQRSQAAPERSQERQIEIPDSIRNNPLFQKILDEQRESQARLVSDQVEQITAEKHYEKAAAELDAKPMKPGQDAEGEIMEVAQVDGKNYYVVEQDGERFAVPAGEKPEHEKGDEITASRTKQGFETGEAYDYGR